MPWEVTREGKREGKTQQGTTAKGLWWRRERSMVASVASSGCIAITRFDSAIAFLPEEKQKERERERKKKKERKEG